MTTKNGFFGAEEIDADRRARAESSGTVASVGRVVQIALRLVSIAVLARLLRPEDFGVRALVLPIIILTNSFINLRLNVAVLQQDNLDSEGLGRVFRLSARFNLLIVLIVAALGPLLAEVYNDARVIGVTAAWAGAVYLLNLGAFHEALLKRQMRFGVTTFIETFAMFVGMIVAIIAASLGAGYWALVLEVAFIGLGRSIGAWVACPWRPPPKVDGERDPRISEMLRFGRNMAGYRMLRWVATQTDRVLIGFFSGAHVLGLYDGARRWSSVPTLESDGALRAVAVSSFGRSLDNPPALTWLVRGAVGMMLVLALPATAFVFIEAEGMVRLLFGDRWLAAVPFAEAMAAGAFFAALTRPTGWLFTALGRTRRQFRWGLVHTATVLTCLLVGSAWGATGIALGYAAAHAILALPTIWFCLRGTPIALRDYLAAAARPVAASVAAAVAALAVVSLFGDIGTAARMTIEFATFAVAYILIWLSLPGGWEAGRAGWSLLRELGRGVGADQRSTAAPSEASVTGD